MRMRAKTGLAGLLGGAVGLLMSSAASAGPAYFDLFTTWQDNSGESQNIDLNADSNLDVGDTLRGILRIPTITLSPSGASPQPGSGANPDLVAIFETEVTAKSLQVGGVNYCSSGTAAGACNGISVAPTYNFEFGPTATFEAVYGTGAMVAFFIDNNLGSTYTLGTTCTTGPGNSCEANVSSHHTLYLTLGMGGTDGDEAWKAFGAPDDPSIARHFTTADNLGGYAAALSVLKNFTGYDILEATDVPSVYIDGIDNDLVMAAIRGAIFGTGNGGQRALDGSYKSQSTNYETRDDTTVLMSAQAVPEPGTLALFGFGLLGLGALGRRRVKK